MGMSKEEMSNLFQRFGQSSRAIQAEYGGTGLGLSICQEIVTLQGGKMSVESEKGHGSTFSFTAYYQPASEEDVKDYLRKTPGQSRRGSVSPVASPVSEPGEATGAAAINAFIPTLTTTITGQSSPSALPEEQQARLTTLKAQLEAEQADREPFRFKHILVAEDNGINQNIMKTYLKKLGYQYTIVNNGQEVLDTFVNKAHDVPIDVILMDCEVSVEYRPLASHHYPDVYLPHRCLSWTDGKLRNTLGNMSISAKIWSRHWTHLSISNWVLPRSTICRQHHRLM